MGDDLIKAFKVARLATFPNFKNLSLILNEEQFSDLWAWLPNRVSIKEPRLIHRTSIDGFNLHIILKKCQDLKETILILKTKSNNVK